MTSTLLIDAADDPVLVELVHRAVATVGADEGSLLLLEPGGYALRFVVCESAMAAKLRGQSQPVGRGVSGLCYQMQQPMIVNDTEADPQFDPTIDSVVGTQTKSILAVPVTMPDDEYGVLTAINKPDGFTTKDLDTFLEFSERVARRLEETGAEVGSMNGDGAGGGTGAKGAGDA